MGDAGASGKPSYITAPFDCCDTESVGLQYFFIPLLYFIPSAVCQETLVGTQKHIRTHSTISDDEPWLCQLFITRTRPLWLRGYGADRKRKREKKKDAREGRRAVTE